MNGLSWAGGKSPGYVTSYPGQLNLLPLAGCEMSTGQSVMMLCSWLVKAGMVHSTCGENVGLAGKTV